jgi:DNA polymerase-1
MFTIIDASHVIHPMYYGLPAMVRPSDGHPVGVVHGMCSTLHRLAIEQPSHIAVVYDHPSSRERRQEIHPDYKSQRPPLPEDLIRQFPLARRAAEVFSMRAIEEISVEADDVINVLTHEAIRQGHEQIVILSTDKDLMQLFVHPEVTMFDPKTKVMKNADWLRNKWGIEPQYVADYLALVGDQTDNVPGIAGIGDKTAAILINAFGDVNGIFDNIDNLDSLPIRGVSKIQATMRESGWRARLSKKLVLLRNDVELPDLEVFRYSGFSHATVGEFLDEMELVTLKEEICAFSEAA